MAQDLIYIFDKVTKARTTLGEIQTNFNMSLVMDGTKDSCKVEVYSFSGVEVEPYTICQHAKTGTWWIVSGDKVERYTNDSGFFYIHNLQLEGAIELLNARDLTDCGFNDNTYNVQQFINRLFSLSTFEYGVYYVISNNLATFFNKNVDFVKTFENYTLLSALREFLDAYNICAKLSFDTNAQNELTTAILHIIPKTGEIGMTPIDIDVFEDVRETKVLNKDSFGTCVVSNAENVISAKHKTFPATGSVRLSSKQYLIVDSVKLNDAVIRLPSKVYKGNWIKIIYPLYLTLHVQGTVTHTFDYYYLRNEISFEKMVDYFEQKIVEDTGSQSIANTFVSYMNQAMKQNLDLASSITLYDGNNIDAYTGEIIKGDNVPYLAEMSFKGTRKSVIFTDKDSKECLKDIKQGIAWERGSNLITGFDMFDGADSLAAIRTDYDQNNSPINHDVVDFTQDGIRILLSMAMPLKDVYTGSPTLANQLSKISFIVDYIPMTDLKVKVDNQRDKKDIQLYNQTGKLVDNVAFSKLINSYSKEISSDKITRYMQYRDFADVPNIGDIVKNGNDIYVINNISLDFYQNESAIEDNFGYYIECEITMCKYVSTKSLMVNPNTNIRDYGIPQNYNVKRKQLYRDYYELAYETFSDANQDTPYYNWEKTFEFPKQTKELLQFVGIIKVTYDHAIGGNDDEHIDPSDTWYYQLETTNYYLDKMLYSVLDFNDNNIIGYGSQNVFSGFIVSRILDGLTDAINTPISYVDEKGKLLGIDILLCNEEQIVYIYDEYQNDNGGSSWVGSLSNYSVFIPEDIYNYAYQGNNYEIRINEQNYKKDAIEVPVFEYVCQIGDSEYVLIGDNILNKHPNCLYFYSYEIGTNLNENNAVCSHNVSAISSPYNGWSVDNGVTINTINDVQTRKMLEVRLFSSESYDVTNAEWHDGSLVLAGYTLNKDLAIFRHALDLTTGQVIATELMFIAKKVPGHHAIANRVRLEINYYKLN